MQKTNVELCITCKIHYDNLSPLMILEWFRIKREKLSHFSSTIAIQVY